MKIAMMIIMQKLVNNYNKKILGKGEDDGRRGE